MQGSRVQVEAAVKHRAQGWRKVRDAMAATRDRNGDADECLFISERARYLATTLPLLIRNSLKPDDIVTRPKGPDHGADALRMLISWQPYEPSGIYCPPTFVDMKMPRGDW